MLRFSDTIGLVGINPCVRVPARISKAFGKRGYVSVVVHLQRGSVSSTLVPIGAGVHRLFVNAEMLRLTDARVGDRVEIGLELDGRSRMPETPGDVLAALGASPVAQKRWAALVPSKRKEIVRYLSFAKSTETRERNLNKLMEILSSATGVGVLCGIRISG